MTGIAEPQIILSSHLEQKLLDLLRDSTQQTALVIGTRLHGTTALLGVSKLPESATKSGEDSPLAGCTASWCPGGLSVIARGVTGNARDQDEAVELIERAEKGHEQGVDKPDIYAIAIEGGISFWNSVPPHKRISSTAETAESIDKWIHKHYYFLRLRVTMSMEVAIGGASADYSSAVRNSFASVQSKLRLDKAAFLVQPPEPQGNFLIGEAPLTAPLDTGFATAEQPASVQLLVPSFDDELPAPSVIFETHRGGIQKVSKLCFRLDMLQYAPRSDGLSMTVASDFRVGIACQLSGAQALLESSQSIQGVEALHFRPPGSGHYYTFLYPIAKDAEKQEANLLKQRQWLHDRLFLPRDRPLIRYSNAAKFDSSPDSHSGKLQDVHKGLKPSGIKGGQTHLIWGSYTYYHYLQDGVNDSGWGCAYRSLQTICSWFRHQHMTDRPIPSHKEIQQTLVDIGDKDRGFVGSRQWIGAIEISFVIETLLGVTAKVITVSKGADLDQKARELADHFDRQGTPVMIGGGVLAYTLLGVDYNAATGECAYLILDPHFTGSDDLKKIQKGQWVAWKKSDSNASAGGKLFVQDAFYNLLCPQRLQNI